MTFNNTRYFTKQTFELQNSSLKVERKNLFDAIEYEVSFEQIDNKKKIETKTNNSLLITGVFFFAFALLFQIGPNDELTAIFMTISFVLIITPFINRKKVITILTYDGDNIELFFNKRNKQDVVQFANQIIEASNAFLIKKYSNVDKALPVEQQLNQIQFLRNREIISEQQYESLKDQLLGRDNKTSIGFTP